MHNPQRLKINKPVHTTRYSDERKIDNSSQYNNVSNFFNECKQALQRHEYEELVHALKDGLPIDINRVEYILSGQSHLFDKFKRIYKP